MREGITMRKQVLDLLVLVVEYLKDPVLVKEMHAIPRLDMRVEG